MRQNIILVLTILIVVTIHVVLNAVTYVSEEQVRESEFLPNRSTYHAGPTGTRAFYDYLSESGRHVMRWREPTEDLLNANGAQVETFVIVGSIKLGFEKEQISSLMRWVLDGGRLVLIDRSPPVDLLPKSRAWTVKTEISDFSAFNTDPTSTQSMTQGVSPLKPIQPGLFTRDVDAVMPSRLAARIKISTDPANEGDSPADSDENPSSARDDQISLTSDESSPAPVIYFGNNEDGLLADYQYGKGRVVLLSDPYIVANNGIALSDNLRLGVNLVDAAGLIAFDEYHQGHGVTQNALVSYFSGTLFLAICAQAALLALLIVWTKGRRFARPLPLPQVDRRSKLEFVASMAELQERSRAFDLAIENIYSRTRRVLARYAGVDYNSPRSEIAARVATRSNLDRNKLETLMRQCEETINGAATNWRQSIDLVRRLREVEGRLGLRMRSRDERQVAEYLTKSEI